MTGSTVAYVAYTFPVLTQTFTVREVAALRERGLDLRVFAARRDPLARLDAAAQEEAGRAEYLRGPVSGAGGRALVRWLLRRPLRFAATFASCLGGRYRDRGLACRLRAPLHFALGIELASRLVDEGPFRRVHAQFVDAGSTVAYTAARLAGVPFSFTNHTAYNPFQLPAKAALADVIVSISAADRERIVADCGEAVRDRISVCRVGIDIAPWSALPRRPEAGRVLIVGGLREKKGHAVLLAAAGELVRRGVSVHVVVAGGGASEAALRDQAARLGVAAEFLGPVGPEVVAAELTRAAVFALPCVVAANGDLDGVPVALMEAMAAGVPVVSTRLSGIPELVEDGVSGLLAAPGDVADLSLALERVLTDDALAGRLARAGRARVAMLHDLEENSAALAHLLREGRP